MKDQCIIFILKNDEKFLLNNINEILEFQKSFDLYFVVRESKDNTSHILQTNKLVCIELSYDSTYCEALKTGLEFVQNLGYQTWIEFGECKYINLREIWKLNQINIDYDREKPILFASRYYNPEKQKKWFKYINVSLHLKMCDPYTRFRIYNKNSFFVIRSVFDYEIRPFDFLNILYKSKDYIEVKIKAKKMKKHFIDYIRDFREKSRLVVFCFCYLPFIKRLGIKKDK